MPLNVVIVGAGIAGLSTAISLRRAGHVVSIYEKSALNNEVGAAVTLPPNSSRAVVAWGVDPVASRFVLAKGIEIGVGATLGQIDYTPLGDWVGHVFGVPFYFAHRVDLHEALKVLATGDEGVGKPAVIHLKSAVASYDPETPSITLQNGQVITADLVIAADGIHSIGIETVLGHVNKPQPQDLYNGCYRFLIPAADLDNDPETAFWNKDNANDGKMRIYSNGKLANRFVSYPCRNHEIWNCVGMFHDPDLKAATHEDWHAPVDKSNLLNSFPDLHPSLRAVLNKATEVKRWPLLYRRPVPTWTKSKLVAVGDAAHPMLPHQGQGASQGIEDALALGIALCGAEKSQIEQRLAVFEKARRNRASAIQIMSNASLENPDLIEEEVRRFVDVVPSEYSIFLSPKQHEKKKRADEEMIGTGKEVSEFNWGCDIARVTEELVREVSPGFKVPEGFWRASPYMPARPVNGNGKI
ncbi:hypothetical protein OQA88_5574 [Cercophora sp. LCS_1]